jgi:selenocysteine-specific elongation factor
MAEGGAVVRTASEIRLASHRVELDERSEDVDRLVRELTAAEPTPPALADLLANGHSREIIDAATRRGMLVRISPDMVMTAGFVERAVEVIRARAAEGITVSAFREAVGTSRKYAVPLLEYLDQKGITRRDGDLRFARG